MTTISNRRFPVLMSAILGLALLGSASAVSADELAPAEPDPLFVGYNCNVEVDQLVCDISHQDGIAGLEFWVKHEDGAWTGTNYGYFNCLINRIFKADLPSGWTNMLIYAETCDGSPQVVYAVPGQSLNEARYQGRIEQDAQRPTPQFDRRTFEIVVEEGQLG